MNRYPCLISLLCALVLVMTACGGNTPASDGASTAEPAPATEPANPPEAAQAASSGTTLDVTMHDIYYGDDPNNIEKPPVWKVNSGESVTLNLDNQGALEHNWIIAKQGENVPVPYLDDQHKNVIEWSSDKVTAGNKANATFTAPASGTYLIFCGIAGHFPVMQGQLVVE